MTNDTMDWQGHLLMAWLNLYSDYTGIVYSAVLSEPYLSVAMR
jgi:hypothetical protein